MLRGLRFESYVCHLCAIEFIITFNYVIVLYNMLIMVRDIIFLNE